MPDPIIFEGQPVILSDPDTWNEDRVWVRIEMQGRIFGKLVCATCEDRKYVEGIGGRRIECPVCKENRHLRLDLGRPQPEGPEGDERW